MPRLDRRRLLTAGLGATLLPTAGPAAASTAKGRAMPHTLDVQERSLAELSAAMAAGQTSATALVAAYTQRIQRIDRAGPRLASVIELNPDAPSIAKALDDERRRQGTRGPLHGMPILIKDNIDTHDRMLTTAGSLALADTRPGADAFLVQRPRTGLPPWLRRSPSSSRTCCGRARRGCASARRARSSRWCSGCCGCWPTR